jgi:hypothetical protein
MRRLHPEEKQGQHEISQTWTEGEKVPFSYAQVRLVQM